MQCPCTQEKDQLFSPSLPGLIATLPLCKWWKPFPWHAGKPVMWFVFAHPATLPSLSVPGCLPATAQRDWSSTSSDWDVENNGNYQKQNTKPKQNKNFWSCKSVSNVTPRSNQLFDWAKPVSKEAKFPMWLLGNWAGSWAQVLYPPLVCCIALGGTGTLLSSSFPRTNWLIVMWLIRKEKVLMLIS